MCRDLGAVDKGYTIPFTDLDHAYYLVAHRNGVGVTLTQCSQTIPNVSEALAYLPETRMLHQRLSDALQITFSTMAKGRADRVKLLQMWIM